MPKSKMESKNNVLLRAKRSNLKTEIATVAKGDLAMTKKLEAKKTSLSVPVYALDGTTGGLMDLPKEIFGVKVNKALLAQATRVYSNNLTGHFSHTKTRSEVSYSTRKVQAQKGTGHARHGSLGAPIYVGGGIALGPKSRKITLDLPKKMKIAALKSALSAKMEKGGIWGITGLEKASGKTKELFELAKKIDKKSMIIVQGEVNENIERAAKNLPGLETITAQRLNAFEVIAHQNLILTKEAVEKLESRIMKLELKEKE